ncbi:hypothetical protein GUJ93_ZPchr0229g18744 [Zizania palustris]|uniref:Uncharacterized protein n=1 Tax=Zizania palustris TaxID=103762 RepID=A0A8J5V2Z3_ZIZPA|nr:hypothetical protein GUJ93_ZPchr0229g18744 [Zizania palustris]
MNGRRQHRRTCFLGDGGWQTRGSSDDGDGGEVWDGGVVRRRRDGGVVRDGGAVRDDGVVWARRRRGVEETKGWGKWQYCSVEARNEECEPEQKDQRRTPWRCLKMRLASGIWKVERWCDAVEAIDGVGNGEEETSYPVLPYPT